MNDLDAVVDKIRQGLLEKSAARERALALSRETIRTSANAIRAIHRHEFDKAAEFSEAERKERQHLQELCAGSAVQSERSRTITPDDIAQGWDAGADYYLTKPFRVEQLVTFVQTLDVLPQPQ